MVGLGMLGGIGGSLRTKRFLRDGEEETGEGNRNSWIKLKREKERKVG